MARKRRIFIFWGVQKPKGDKDASESGSRIGIRKFGSRVPKIVRQHRDKYRRISQILDNHPEVLEAAAADLAALSAPGNKGREADFTAENLLRALIVMSRQGLTFRETILQIADSGFLQDFARLRKKPVVDFSTLDKAFLAIRPETWKCLNDALGSEAADADAASADALDRGDCGGSVPLRFLPLFHLLFSPPAGWDGGRSAIPTRFS